MHAKNKQTKKKSIIFIAIGLVLAAGVILGSVFQDTIRTVAGAAVNIENSGKPTFVFDTAEFPDWASSGTTWHDSDDTGVDAIISVTQCTEGSSCSDLVEKCQVQPDESNQSCQSLEKYTADGCMVHAYHSSQPINPDTAVVDELKQWSSLGDSFKVDPKEVSVKTLSMSTPEGDKSYQFHQYDTNISGDYKQGSAFGFISLDGGHIEVRSTCWEASQLDATLPIVRAIRLEM